METFVGHVRSAADAIILFEACRQGQLPRVQRRLSQKERQSIKPGSVFVWDEREAGMKRWTDGKSWSASRVAGSFLTYREMEGKRGGIGIPPLHVQTRDLPRTLQMSENVQMISSDVDMAQDEGQDGYRYKVDGLIKQSFSIKTADKHLLHLISYDSRIQNASSQLHTPTSDPALRHIRPPKGMYPEPAVSENENIPAVTRSPLIGAPYPTVPQMAGHVQHGAPRWQQQHYHHPYYWPTPQSMPTTAAHSSPFHTSASPLAPRSNSPNHCTHPPSTNPQEGHQTPHPTLPPHSLTPSPYPSPHTDPHHSPRQKLPGCVPPTYDDRRHMPPYPGAPRGYHYDYYYGYHHSRRRSADSENLQLAQPVRHHIGPAEIEYLPLQHPPHMSSTRYSGYDVRGLNHLHYPPLNFAPSIPRPQSLQSVQSRGSRRSLPSIPTTRPTLLRDRHTAPDSGQQTTDSARATPPFQQHQSQPPSTPVESRVVGSTHAISPLDNAARSRGDSTGNTHSVRWLNDSIQPSRRNGAGTVYGTSAASTMPSIDTLVNDPEHGTLDGSAAMLRTSHDAPILRYPQISKSHSPASRTPHSKQPSPGDQRSPVSMMNGTTEDRERIQHLPSEKLGLSEDIRAIKVLDRAFI